MGEVPLYTSVQQAEERRDPRGRGVHRKIPPLGEVTGCSKS